MSFFANRVLNKVLERNVCKISTCLTCFIEDMKRENLHQSPESALLKTAFKRKIIQNATAKIDELKRNDEKKIKHIQ